ncbi:hypothetical protein EVAR_53883_1 [Eumeta japonica]|uniref:Uncharacterized protein n=1 Tax=Eumeta variegata TaxID=151549 RepID=A0A4C1XIT4_EUMVA|nr:hypothetical protein EVAR_53883_1 [Eumeta japonica]
MSHQCFAGVFKRNRIFDGGRNEKINGRKKKTHIKIALKVRKHDEANAKGNNADSNRPTSRAHDHGAIQFWGRPAGHLTGLKLKETTTSPRTRPPFLPTVRREARVRGRDGTRRTGAVVEELGSDSVRVRELLTIIVTATASTFEIDNLPFFPRHGASGF